MFYFSPYSFLGCDVKDMMKCQAQISLTNPVSIYTDNHSSLHWRVSECNHYLECDQASNTLSVINTFPLRCIYQISLKRKLGPLGKRAESIKLSMVTGEDFVRLVFLPFDT